MKAWAITWLATLALVFQGLLSAWLLPQMAAGPVVAAEPVIVAQADWPPCHGDPPAPVVSAAPVCGDCCEHCPWAQACQPPAALMTEWRVLDWTIRLSLAPATTPGESHPAPPPRLKPPIRLQA